MTLVLLVAGAGRAQQAGADRSLDRTMRGTGASAVLLDVAGNRVVAQAGPEVRGLAGSTLKPFVLLEGLSSGLVKAGTTVECRGELRVGGRNLACTHPRTETVFDARGALAYSCNTWFARLAERMTPGQIREALVPFGLPMRDGGDRVLTVLGLVGERVTPMEMARAYRLLALHPNAVVDGGLADGVQFGMADNARMPWLRGKTVRRAILVRRGTGQGWTHGWFAGDLLTAGEAGAGGGGVCAAGERGGCGGAGPEDSGAMMRWVLLAMLVGVGSAACAQDQPSRDLTVRLFDTVRVTRVTVTPVREGARWKACAGCEWKALERHLTLSWKAGFVGVGFAGTVGVDAGGEHGAVAAGIWQVDAERDSLRVRVTVPSERYVAAVLMAEAAADEPPASLRALAIVVRSYGLAHKGPLTDSTSTQTMRLGMVSKAVEAAVSDTAGETLWYGGHQVPDSLRSRVAG